MMDVNDGVYQGILTPEQVIEQFKYRIMIHESYIGLVLEDPHAWSAFGSAEFHYWAINGYEWGIKYIKEHSPTRCTLGEAIIIIIKAILRRS